VDSPSDGSGAKSSVRTGANSGVRAYLGLLEARDPLLGSGERDAVAVLAGLDPERDPEMGFPGTGRVAVALLML